MNPQIHGPRTARKIGKQVSQADQESIITLGDITWDRFQAIKASFQGLLAVRLFYLAGVLEIISSPSRKHERIKSTLGLLLEAYMKEKGIRFYLCGRFPIEKTGYAYGAPDDSYCISSDKDVPDIVIEVIMTSGAIDKLELYKQIEVPEVWLCQSNQLRIFNLRKEEYHEVPRSRFFPDLDLALLLRYIDYPDQYDAVQEFQAVIRGDL
ncbi:MAG: Uma2 family endonuclease [Hormoscilla sp. GUM202]|nr:Uma2 family endonuclease [Hormoscilla sp. GUM202]